MLKGREGYRDPASAESESKTGRAHIPSEALCFGHLSLALSLSRAPARNQAEPMIDFCVPVAAEKRAASSTSVSKFTAVGNEARITAESRFTRV